MSQDKSPEKTPVSLNDVWEQLDRPTRDRVIELFAGLVYQNAVARHEESMKEVEHVSPGRNAKDQAGTY